MRTAKAQDYWRAAFRNRYKNYVEEIDLQGLIGIEKVSFKSGIFALCGLNGAGKSTVLAALKDTLGIKLSEKDENTISGHQVLAKIFNENQMVECKNLENERATDLGLAQELIGYVDYEIATKIIGFLYSQKNIEELLEQYELHDLSESEISNIDYIIGKHYDHCSIVELEDIDKLGTIPFFRVNSHGIDYDSRRMGAGEHFLFYIYWVVHKLERNSILLIEEPETFISIASQENLMNYLASVAAKNNITIILSTHSPFILKNIPNKNIRIISRYGNSINIREDSTECPALTLLGGISHKKGIIFVEDFVAKLFLKSLLETEMPTILRDFKIESVDGEAGVTERLKSPYYDFLEHKLIGVYDGDVKDIVEAKKGELKWPYTFLPLDVAIEHEFRTFLRDSGNIEPFGNCIEKDHTLLLTYLAKYDGDDCHDWFLNLCTDLSIDHQYMIKCFYKLWSISHEDIVKAFIECIDDLTS